MVVTVMMMIIIAMMMMTVMMMTVMMMIIAAMMMMTAVMFVTGPHRQKVCLEWRRLWGWVLAPNQEVSVCVVGHASHCTCNVCVKDRLAPHRVSVCVVGGKPCKSLYM